MKPELPLLKVFLSFEHWKKYSEYISVTDIHEDLRFLYRCLDSYHKSNEEEKDLSVADLSLLVFSNNPKNKEFLEEVLANLDTITADLENVIGYINAVHQNKIYREIALASYAVAEGKSDAKIVSALVEQLSVLAPVKTEVESEETLFVPLDLQAIVDKAVKAKGLRWRLTCLNKSFGSLRKGNFGFIFARPESFSRDTEVLTPEGWLSVGQVTLNHKIAQVDEDRKITFVHPLSVHEHSQNECVHIHDTLGRVDLIVTKGHAMVYEKNKKLLKERAEDILYYQSIKHHTGGIVEGDKELSFYERFLIAYQADGYSKYYQNKNGSWVGFLKFKKERKIKRLRWILNNLNCEWAEYNKDKKDQIEFRVVLNLPIYKDFSWVKLDNIDSNWGHSFLQELSHWDSSIRTTTRFKYDTTNKSCADLVQAVGTLSGYSIFHSVHKDNRKDTFKDVHSLSIRPYVPVDGQCIKKKIIPFSDTTYCFKVPTGMLLVRRNGATAVCGNTGKTTFLASEVSFMLTQTDQVILWLNNEQEGEAVMLRLYQAFFGVTLTELLGNVEHYSTLFKEATKGRFKLLDSAQISKAQVEQLCKKYNPGLILIDQIDKIKGFDDDREDLRLGSIYIWARELAKQYGPVIGVCQADASGENVRYLTMANVANAKTSKQAEADWILGIGKIHDSGWENVRFFNISKNKLLGDEDTDSKLRHGQFSVLIEPEIARYKDLGKAT